MKVQILNPDILANLYKNHGEFASVCYNTPAKYAESVGESCQKSGHVSGSRCEYIKFRISDVDRGTAEQILRHEIGTFVPFEYQDNYSFADYAEVVKDVSPDQIVKNMASFRYIDKSGFRWEMPKLISCNQRVADRYNALMEYINNERSIMKDWLVEDGADPKKANESINFVLPRATTTEFVIGFTPEALIHFCHKRLCLRAQEFIREFASKCKLECAKYNAKYASELKPHCEHLLWCPEGAHSCGRLPCKEDLAALLTKVMEVA